MFPIAAAVAAFGVAIALLGLLVGAGGGSIVIFAGVAAALAVGTVGYLYTAACEAGVRSSALVVRAWSGTAMPERDASTSLFGERASKLPWKR